jgi:ribosomal protein L29
MAKLKASDIKKMSKEERNKKLKELRLELVKSKAEALKGGSSKTRDAKKAIARMLTLNTSKGKLKDNK